MGRPTKTCRIAGQLARASGPRATGSVGTSRQPRQASPFRSSAFSTRRTARVWGSWSGEEEHPDPERLARLEPESEAVGLAVKEPMGDLGQNPRAVPRIVGGGGPSVCHPRHRLERHPHDFMGALPAGPRHEPTPQASCSRRAWPLSVRSWGKAGDRDLLIGDSSGRTKKARSISAERAGQGSGWTSARHRAGPLPGGRALVIRTAATGRVAGICIKIRWGGTGSRPPAPPAGRCSA